jgi:hypothetical protein
MKVKTVSHGFFIVCSDAVVTQDDPVAAGSE